MPALFAPPAVIHPLPLVRVRFGLQVSTEPSARIEYAELTMPRDFRDGTLDQWLPYIPSDLHHLPPWVLMSMLPGMGAAILAGGGLIKTTTFLTSTSASDQTGTVLADWNSADNSLNVISSGANGGGTTSSSAGGGGGFAKAVNQSLTPSGSYKFRLRAANAGSGTTNACWIGGSGTTSLATSLAGIQCAGGSTGASTTSAIGTTKNAGGNGGASFDGDCCGHTPRGGGGGGAAGPGGIGGNGGNGSAGSNGSGGTGNGGLTSGGANGAEFGTVGAGGGGSGNDSGAAGNIGGLYGGGGGQSDSGGGAGRQGLIVAVNNASL